MTRSVHVRTRKWPDEPHWEFEGVLLGADAHGRWVGVPAGTLLSRPGRSMPAAAPHVVLVPDDAWWVATLYGDDPARPFDLYVDVTTPAIWSEDEVRAVDLDLDVVRDTRGTVWVDDEDEFAEHQVSLGYPAGVVAAARASADALLAAVRSAAPPFDGSHREWIERLVSVAPGR